MRAKPLHTDEAIEILGRECGRSHQCITELKQTHSQTHTIAPPGGTPGEKTFMLNSYALCDGKVYRQVVEHILLTDEPSMLLCLALADEKEGLVLESHWTEEALGKLLGAIGLNFDELPRSFSS